MNVLHNFSDEAGLEGLGDKITEVERELEAADLDAKIEALRSARNKQTLWIKNYEDELDSLKKEVENVQEIRSSLDKTDTKCWKRTRLEP
jgi:chromosome segregation ATPase